jgi:hypothetical protein
LNTLKSAAELRRRRHAVWRACTRASAPRKKNYAVAIVERVLQALRPRAQRSFSRQHSWLPVVFAQIDELYVPPPFREKKTKKNKKIAPFGV